MTYEHAIRLAIECINSELQRLAVDANLREIYGAEFPAAKRASKRRRELQDALEVLRSALDFPIDCH